MEPLSDMAVSDGTIMVVSFDGDVSIWQREKAVTEKALENGVERHLDDSDALDSDCNA